MYTCRSNHPIMWILQVTKTNIGIVNKSALCITKVEYILKWCSHEI